MNKEFVKKNNCPYCTYFSDSAGMLGGDDRPQPGDLTFCIMCSQPSQYDETMTLIKFDLNSIRDIKERVRLKAIQQGFDDFYEHHPEASKDKELLERREHYLKIMDANT
jgi:hypothetical protein